MRPPSGKSAGRQWILQLENLDRMHELGIDGYVPDSNLARELNTGQRATGMGSNPQVRHSGNPAYAK